MGFRRLVLGQFVSESVPAQEWHGAWGFQFGVGNSVGLQFSLTAGPRLESGSAVFLGESGVLDRGMLMDSWGGAT